MRNKNEFFSTNKDVCNLLKEANENSEDYNMSMFKFGFHRAIFPERINFSNEQLSLFVQDPKQFCSNVKAVNRSSATCAAYVSAFAKKFPNEKEKIYTRIIKDEDYLKSILDSFSAVKCVLEVYQNHKEDFYLFFIKNTHLLKSNILTTSVALREFIDIYPESREQIYSSIIDDTDCFRRLANCSFGTLMMCFQNHENELIKMGIDDPNLKQAVLEYIEDIEGIKLIIEDFPILKHSIFNLISDDAHYFTQLIDKSSNELVEIFFEPEFQDKISIRTEEIRAYRQSHNYSW